MTTVEFASKAAADAVRDDFPDALCDDDDRRLKTVRFSSEASEHVVEDAHRRAAIDRGEREGPGQEPLTDAEMSHIDFAEGRASVPHARSVKAIARAEGVDDWLAYYDPTLTVDEHRQVMARGARDERGQRMDVDDEAARARRHAVQAQAGECDHVETHCVEGDEDACEFLIERCDVEEEEVQALLSDFDADPPADEIEGKWLGALQRSWAGYKGAVSRMRDALDEMRSARKDAEAAAKAINGIRQAHGQEEIERFDALDDALNQLAVAGTPATSPVGPPDGRQAGIAGHSPFTDDRQQFAVERQGTLGGVGVDPEEAAEDMQVTLTGEDVDDATGPLPGDWSVSDTWGTDPAAWSAGPFTVQLVEHREGWGAPVDVVLTSDGGDREEIATDVRDTDMAREVAQEFVDRLSPADVSFHRADPAVPTAAAEAKTAAISPETGQETL